MEKTRCATPGGAFHSQSTDLPALLKINIDQAIHEGSSWKAPMALADEGSPANARSRFYNSIIRSTCNHQQRFSTVMAGLDPAIHAGRLGLIFACCPERHGVDTRDKTGHDGGDCDGALLNVQTKREPQDMLGQPDRHRSQTDADGLSDPQGTGDQPRRGPSPCGPWPP
ncbi:UNVERIFIED_ORG: hypothetical protein ABID33_001073 [Xanthobacter viscosus]|uniref:hypothetical protein n=1 Tax=Xanthobacter autotrophicus TaxID=280 RepID=UPI0014770F1F|nr:hypothetical protein [Xanthobacter autotrophicus]